MVSPIALHDVNVVFKTSECILGEEEGKWGIKNRQETDYVYAPFVSLSRLARIERVIYHLEAVNGKFSLSRKIFYSYETRGRFPYFPIPKRGFISTALCY